MPSIGRQHIIEFVKQLGYNAGDVGKMVIDASTNTITVERLARCMHGKPFYRKTEDGEVEPATTTEIVTID